MKAILCTLLALLQVLICTVGQGALTICVRTDGTKRLEWTHFNCCSEAHSDNTCPCGCSEEKACFEENSSQIPSSSAVYSACNSCTDHVLLAEQASAIIGNQQSQLKAVLYFLNVPMSLELGTYQSLSVCLDADGPESGHAVNFASIATTLVMRC